MEKGIIGLSDGANMFSVVNVLDKTVRTFLAVWRISGKSRKNRV